MHQVSSLIQHYGLLVVFVSVLLDLGGAPLPSYPVLLVAGALSLSGGAPVPVVIAVGLAAAIVADLAWYAAGAKLGSRVLSLLCRFTFSPDSCVRQTQNTFARIGPWSLLFAKFVPGLGYVSVALSGITGLGLSSFVMLDAVGDALYVALPVVLGRVFHTAIDSVLSTLIRLGEYGVLIVAALLVLYIAGRWIERQAFVRRLKMDRISVDELAQMIDAGRTPVIFDVRPSAVRLKDGVIPGAVAADPDDIRSLVARYARDVEVVIYCACPNEASAALAALHLKRAGYRKIRPLLGGVDAWTEAGHPLQAAVAAIADEGRMLDQTC